MEPITYITKPNDEARKAEEVVRQHLSGVSINTPLVVAVGGDGTMLQAVKQHYDKEAIFIGVSAGSLGLLQTVNMDQLPQLVDALNSGSFETIRAPLLSVSYCQPGGDNAQDDTGVELIGYGFNDVSIERQQSRAAKFRLKIDESAGDFIGDGVIFCTPLGSTAYSLAAGGPIIDSKLQNIFVVTPNNPHLSSLHSSLQRPHVLSGSRRVRLEVATGDQDRPLQVSIDGEVAATEVTRPLSIRISDRIIQLLQLGPDRLSHQIEEKRLGKL